MGKERSNWPSDVQQWPSGQTEPLKAAKGRANSELRNVAPAEGGRPQNNSELRQPAPIGAPVRRPKGVTDNKVFRPQFDDWKE